MTCQTAMRRRANLTRTRDDVARLARRATDPRITEATLARLITEIAEAKRAVATAEKALEDHIADCGC